MIQKYIILYSALAPLLFASPPPQNGKLSLGGIVINSATGEPVPHALVHLTLFIRNNTVPGDTSHPPTPPTVTNTFTDSAGAFHLAGLAAGSYFITAQKPQFAPAETNRVEIVELTESTSNIQIKLLPLAVITGKVVDEDGQPVWDARVYAITVRATDGLRQTHNDRSVSTDERGVFRMWNVQPGQYYLKAAGRARATYSYIGDTVPQFYSDEGFAPSYHGGGHALVTATPLEIRAGTETNADIKVRMESAWSIRGALGNFTPHRTVQFQLIRDNEAAPASPVSVNGETGKFEVEGVVKGRYTLHAIQDDKTGDVSVTLDGGNIDGVSLTLYPGVDIRVITSVPGSTANWAPDAANAMPGPGACNVTLYHADGQSESPLPLRSRFDRPNEITIHGVKSGLYDTVISCFGVYVQSATIGDQDLLANPEFNVNAGSENRAIQITAIPGGGWLTGKLAGAAAEFPNVAIVLAPQFTGSAGPFESGVENAGQGGENSHSFRFQNLPPGTYTVYAFPDAARLEYRNPKFLQSLTGGATVQIENHGEKEITITGVIQ